MSHIYRQDNNLLISLKYGVVTNSKTINNLTILFDCDNQMLGYNIINISDDIKNSLSSLMVTKNDKVINYINKTLEENNLQPIVFVKPNFIVGKVIECEEIINTHLHKTVVDLNNEKVQIVCGAKNIKSGLLVVVAKIGTMMFDGTYIMHSTLKSVDSYGMICSGYELMLDGYQKKQGILELGDSYHIGDYYFK